MTAAPDRPPPADALGIPGADAVWLPDRPPPADALGTPGAHAMWLPDRPPPADALGTPGAHAMWLPDRPPPADALDIPGAHAMWLPDRPPLADALGIPGAHAVSLLDPDGPAVLWWAGTDAPGRRLAATVTALATAAAGLVSLTGPADDLGDIILTSADAFHVVRPVGDGTDHVAHLRLRRAHANLAMARREFGLLVDGYALRPRHAAGLPRRERGEPPGQPEPVAAELPPDWFALINQPYVTDERALDRILVTLRTL